jgi:hypothetical protein
MQVGSQGGREGYFQAPRLGNKQGADMNKPFKAGHLADGGPLVHRQTTPSREIMSKKSRQYWTLQKLKAPALNWKKKT